jgi:hypothetical protein
MLYAKSSYCAGIALVISMGYWGAASRADETAPVATATKAQGIVERRAAKSDTWNVVPVGASIFAGDMVATGHLALVEVQFTDTSKMCLGPVAAVEFVGASPKLIGGRLDYYAVHPCIILIGPAVLEITGSTVRVELKCDGSVEAALDHGAVSVATPKGRIKLEPGKAVTVSADGSISPLHAMTEQPLDPQLAEAGDVP